MYKRIMAMRQLHVKLFLYTFVDITAELLRKSKK
jgi:hypothetical protein